MKRSQLLENKERTAKPQRTRRKKEKTLHFLRVLCGSAVTETTRSPA
jgi:hypothetical protein